MSTSSISLPAIGRRARPRARALAWPPPELAVLLALAAVLYLWSLGRNGYANEYYSAAVRSMTQSWHAFLFGSFDRGGVMTVDKPPLALWVQALSARAFGYSSWSMLVPQAVMGVASVALVWDMTRRRFGRAAGFGAGLALALTPTAVAISRHNNPDALLVLCVTAAVWFLIRGLRGRPHALAGAVGRVRRARVRGQDGRGAAGRARARGGMAVDRAARPHGRGSPARAGRRGHDRRRAGVAGAGVVDAGVQQALDLRHRRQQHLVADLRLQRPGPAGRAAGSARRWRRSLAVAGAAARSAGTRACCGCSTRASAGRAVGCSASRSWREPASSG